MNKTTLFITAILFAATTQAQITNDAPNPYQFNGNVKEIVLKNTAYENAHSLLLLNHDTREMLLTAYDKNGKAAVVKTMKVNEAGEITQVKFTDSKSLCMYEFANDRKVAEKVITDGEIWTRKVYTYYGNGSLHQVNTYDKNGITTDIETYTYTNNKETTVVHTDGDGKLKATSLYKYDEHDNIVSKQVHAHAWGQEWSQTFSYEYDTHGNYTKCTMYKNGKSYGTHMREITYM